MKLAVEQGKMSKIQEKERVEENAADAVADEIRADEEAEETKPIKKKKQNLKKGKKLDIWVQKVVFERVWRAGWGALMTDKLEQFNT